MKGNGGFTLIEVIASLTILAMLGAVAGLFIVSGVNSFVIARQNNEYFQKINLAMTRLSREMAFLTDIDEISATSIKYKRGTDLFSISKVGADLVKINNSQTLPDADTGFTLINGTTGFVLTYKKSDGVTDWEITDNINELYRIGIQINCAINNVSKSFIITINPLYNNTYNGPV